MSKRFLWLVMGLSFLQSSFAADADDVDDEIVVVQEPLTDQEYAQNVKAFYKGLASGQICTDQSHIASIVRRKVDEITRQLEALEQEGPDHEVQSIKKDLGHVAQLIKGIKDSSLKRELNESVAQIFVRFDQLLPKKEKKKAKQKTAIKDATAVLKFLPEDLEKYPQQTEYNHTGAPLKNCFCGLVSQFPKILSPDRGYVVINNGFVKKILIKANEKNVKKEVLTPQEHLVDSLFNISQEGNLVLTALPANPVLGLSPFLLGQLLRMLITGDSAYRQVFIVEWKNTYLGLQAISGKSESRFNNHAHNFFKTVDASYAIKSQETLDLLLGYLYLSIESERDFEKKASIVQGYARGLGLVYMPSYYTEDDFIIAKEKVERKIEGVQLEKELEAILFCTKVNNPYKVFYFSPDSSAVYKGRNFAACAENTVRTLLTLILANPDTLSLDLGVLPRIIKPSSELKNFVEQYGDFKKGSSYGDKAYIELVENRPGIAYATNNEFNLVTTTQNIVALFKLLFGLTPEFKKKQFFNGLFDRWKVVNGKEPHEQFIELMHMFSTPEHRIEVKLREHTENKDTFTAILTVPQSDFIFEVELMFSDNHAAATLKESFLILDFETGNFILNMYNVGKVFNQWALGVCSINPMKVLTELLSFDVITEESQLESFFNIYTSNAYPDYKSFFLLNDLHAYKRLFSFYNRGGNTELCRALLNKIKEMGVWGTGFEDPTLWNLLKDSFANKHYALADELLRAFPSHLTINQIDILVKGLEKASYIKNKAFIDVCILKMFRQNQPIDVGKFFIKSAEEFTFSSNENVLFLVMEFLSHHGIEISVEQKKEMIKKIITRIPQSARYYPSSDEKMINDIMLFLFQTIRIDFTEVFLEIFNDRSISREASAAAFFVMNFLFNNGMEISVDKKKELIKAVEKARKNWHRSDQILSLSYQGWFDK